MFSLLSSRASETRWGVGWRTRRAECISSSRNSVGRGSSSVMSVSSARMRPVPLSSSNCTARAWQQLNSPRHSARNPRARCSAVPPALSLVRIRFVVSSRSVRRAVSRRPRKYRAATASGCTIWTNCRASKSVNRPGWREPTVTTPRGSAGVPIRTRMLERMPASRAASETSASPSVSARSSMTCRTGPLGGALPQRASTGNESPIRQRVTADSTATSRTDAPSKVPIAQWSAAYIMRSAFATGPATCSMLSAGPRAARMSRMARVR